MSPEQIVLNTSDGVRIAGAYYDADQPRGLAFLLHMMPAAKESWSAFAFALSARGIASLAIDLRGHGASEGGPDGYRGFTDERHRASERDAEAAMAWLRAKARLPLLAAGASIGANLAIRAAAAHPDVAACLALSPGLAYHGVTTSDALPALRDAQRLLLVASVEDAEAAACADAADASARANVVVRRLQGAGHGTRMFDQVPDLLAEAADWLAASV